MVKLIGSKKQQEKNRLHIELEIDEDAGELLCDKCEGKGGNICNHPSSDLTKPQWVRCTKCQGRGKVDWVSHITGVPAPKMFGFSSTSSSSSWAGAHCHDDAIDAMSKALAAKIDEEILESIINDSNKYLKSYNPGGT